MEKFVIIVAGGKGLRMGGDIPKQFLPIKGKPILMRTMERFYEYDVNIHIVLVLPESQVEYWLNLCQQYKFTLSYQLVHGGETRYHSVLNGLSSIQVEEALVAVHDGVRPFVSLATIASTFAEAEKFGVAVPVIDCVDSVREIVNTDGDSQAKERAKLRLVQTPQTFKLSLLKKAYSLPYTTSFTDDASVVEAYGVKVVLTDGNRENIKITTSFDLKVAEIL